MLSDYWIGFYGLAYVPSPDIPEDGPTALIGANESGDYIFNIWQGDMTSSGFAEGSFTGLTLYDKNITSNYRYVYDPENMCNRLVTWSTSESNQYGRNGYLIYEGVKRTDEGTGGTGDTKPSEIPMPAPLFFCGNRFSYNVPAGFDLNNVPTAATSETVPEGTPMVTPDMRNYPSDAIELDPEGPYTEAIQGTPGMYSSVASDDESRTRDEDKKVLADQYNGLISISNYNKTHGHVSSEGFPIDYQEVCHNMSRATRLFPISAYKVNSVSETEDPETEGVAKAKTLEYKIDIDIRNGSLAKNLLEFTGTGLFAGKEACSFKFNRIGIYAVPVSLHRFAKEGDSGTVCSDSHVQVEISPDAEPVLFAVALVDEMVMSEDGSLGSNRYQLDFTLNLVDASGDCALVRDVDVYYNMYENQAITWYQNQLLATAGMSEAITSLGVDVAYLKNRNAASSAPIVIENNTNGDGFGGSGLKHLLDAANPGSLRGSDAKAEEDGYQVGTDSVALGKDTGVPGDCSFITGRGSVVQGDNMVALGVNGLDITADTDTHTVVLTGGGSPSRFTNVKESKVNLYGAPVDAKDIEYSDVTNVDGGLLHGISDSVVRRAYVPSYVGTPEFKLANGSFVMGTGTTVSPVDDIYGVSQSTMFGTYAVDASSVIGSGATIHGSVGSSSIIGNVHVSEYSPNFAKVVNDEYTNEPTIVPDAVDVGTKLSYSMCIGGGMSAHPHTYQTILVGGGLSVQHHTYNSILVGGGLNGVRFNFSTMTASQVESKYGEAGVARPSTPIIVTKDDTTQFTLTDSAGATPVTFDFSDMPVDDAEYMVIKFTSGYWHYAMPGTGVAGNSDPDEWSSESAEWKEAMHARNYWLAVNDYLEHRGPDGSVMVGSGITYGPYPTRSILLGNNVKMANLQLTDSIIMSSNLEAFNPGNTGYLELASIDYGHAGMTNKSFNNVKVMCQLPQYMLKSFERSGDTAYKDSFIFTSSNVGYQYEMGAWLGLGFNSEQNLSDSRNSLPLGNGTYETRHVYATWNSVTGTWTYGLSKDGIKNQALPSVCATQDDFDNLVGSFLSTDVDGTLYKHMFADQGKPAAHMIYTGGIALAGNQCQDEYGADSSYGYGLLKLGSCYGSAYIKSFMSLPSDTGKAKSRFNIIDYSGVGGSTGSWSNGHTWLPGRARVFPTKLIPGTEDCPYGGRPLVVDYEQELDGTFHVKLGDPIKAEVYGTPVLLTGTKTGASAVDLLDYDGTVVYTDASSYIEVNPPTVVGQRTLVRHMSGTFRVAGLYCADGIDTNLYRGLYSGYVYCLESMRIEGTGGGLYWKLSEFSRPEY